MADFVEKIMGRISEFLWLKINGVFQVVSGNFSLHVPLLAAQASILEKLFCDYSTWFSI